MPQHLLQVLGIGEVLDGRVEHDEIEEAVGQPVDVIRGRGPQPRPVGQFRALGDLLAELGDCGGRDVAAPVLFALRGELGQHQPAADTDLQHAPWGEGAQPLDRGGTPLPHRRQRNRVPVITTHPAGEVLAPGCLRAAGVQRVVERPPFLDLVGFAGREPSGSRGRHDVGDQLRPDDGVVLPDDGGMGDLGVPGEGRLHLGWLDPQAPDLDLIVRPADVVELAVPAPPRQVSGAVHPFSVGGERIGDEPLRGEPRLVGIASREPCPTDVELAGDAGRARPEACVQHVGAQTGTGSADRRVRPGQRIGQGRAHRGFGRPVAVDQPTIAGPCGGGGWRARLPHHDQRAHGGQLVRSQRGQCAGLQDEMRDTVALGRLGQFRAERGAGARWHHQRGAVEQSAEQLGDDSVEAERGELQHPRARS